MHTASWARALQHGPGMAALMPSSALAAAETFLDTCSSTTLDHT
jgi:hypothetical protein